jgi:hypothetical protein
MNEIASLSIEAISIVDEGKARSCFIGMITWHIVSKFRCSMCKLAFVAIGTASPICKISTKGSLNLGAIILMLNGMRIFEMVILMGKVYVIALSRNIIGFVIILVVLSEA